MLSKLAGLLGVVLLLVAAALGFRSVSTGGVNCGSTFQPAPGITPLACDERLSGRSTAVAVVGGLGAIGVVASVATSILRERREED